jgi:hypothetical protein
MESYLKMCCGRDGQVRTSPNEITAEHRAILLLSKTAKWNPRYIAEAHCYPRGDILKHRQKHITDGGNISIGHNHLPPRPVQLITPPSIPICIICAAEKASLNKAKSSISIYSVAIPQNTLRLYYKEQSVSVNSDKIYVVWQ